MRVTREIAVDEERIYALITADSRVDITLFATAATDRSCAAAHSDLAGSASALVAGNAVAAHRSVRFRDVLTHRHPVLEYALPGLYASSVIVEAVHACRHTGCNSIVVGAYAVLTRIYGRGTKILVVFAFRYSIAIAIHAGRASVVHGTRVVISARERRRLTRVGRRVASDYLTNIGRWAAISIRLALSKTGQPRD